jgi:hypothetical protein
MSASVTCAARLAASLLVLLALTASAAAEEPEQQTLLLRLAVGGDVGSTIVDDAARVRQDGAAALVNLDLGLFLARDVVIHGRATRRHVVWTEASRNDAALGSGATDLRATLLGLGLTLYPSSRWYLAVSAGAVQSRLSVRGRDIETRIGYGFESDLGREWGLGDSGFALGVGGRLTYYSIAAGGGDAVWLGYGIVISASYH